MKVAIVGSRGITDFDLTEFIPEGTTEIVSGGAKGVDRVARKYAQDHNIELTEFLPNYDEFGRGAPLVRNIEIIKYSDIVLAFWDGTSRGTAHVINNCKKLHVKCMMYELIK